MHEVRKPHAGVYGGRAAGRRGRALRILACGSPGDGKSALTGRLVRDCAALFGDPQMAPAEAAGCFGARGETPAIAHPAGGIPRAHAQGSAVDDAARDVAYRYFSTPEREFVIADASGDDQHTRAIVAAASTAELAILLVDARRGLVTQACRESCIAALFGIGHVVLAVNKMDTVGWDRAAFERIAAAYRTFAAAAGIAAVTAIPLSALTGDNVTRAGANMPWYDGPTLLELMASIGIAPDAAERQFRMPVRQVVGTHDGCRGYSGTVASGTVRPGDRVAVLPSGQTTTVRRVASPIGDRAEALPGHVATLTLADDLDIGPGAVIAAAAARPAVAEQFAAHLIWMNESAMLPGRSYLFAHSLLADGGDPVGAQITEIKHQINVNTLEHVAAKHLDRNEIGFCNLALDRPLAFDPYNEIPATGGFTLIDRLSRRTVGCGVIAFALRRAANIHWQPTKIDKAARAGLKGQKPCVLWLTGLSGAGKSTIADLVEQSLHRQGRHTVILDGDNVRHGLNRDLGFTDEDRVENIRRVAEVAKLMVQSGLIVLVSFISPFRSERMMVRGLFEPGEFFEIFVDTPLQICEARDPKGLYKLARAGKLPNMTGVGSPYEPPEHPELRLSAAIETPETLADEVLAALKRHGII